MIGEKYILNGATLQLNDSKCTGCIMCVVVCPHAVFAMKNKKAAIINRDACMECGACARNCASGAISVRSGVGCAAGILNGILNNTEASCDCSGNSGGCC